MLEDALFESGNRKKARSPISLLISAVVHAVIVTACLLIPLAYTEVIPVMTASTLLMPPQPPPPEHVAIVAAPAASTIPLIVDTEAFVAPTAIPREIATIIEAPPATNLRVPSAPSTGAVRSILESALRNSAAAPPPPPPPPPAVPELVQSGPIRVGGVTQQGKLIHRVDPVYPALARQARVSGTVMLDATITTEGRIENLRVLRGHALLDAAAIEAVQQWQYQPTLLNGRPVAVISTITINFRLQ